MRHLMLLAVGAAILTPRDLPSQTLARRVAIASAPNVEFVYAARHGTCGDGRSFIRIDVGSYIGSHYDGMRTECEGGPVRVVVVRVDREPIRIETYVGPVAHDSLATDLGRVAAGEAAAYLVQLAKSNEGRVARDAMAAAVLADSASIAGDLLAIARDGSRARKLRRSALGWATHPRVGIGIGVDEGIRALLAIAQDTEEHQSMRQHAVSLMGRYERGEGIAALIAVAQSDADPWLARRAVETLARAGDPRARRAVRDLVAAEGTSEEIRSAAISALANDYATGRDAELVRGAYARLTSDRTRDAAISAAASIGDEGSQRWLASLVKNRDQAMRQRRRAAEQLNRSGASAAEVSALYDAVDDVEVRFALIDALAQNGNRDAAAKLLSIARSDPETRTRRRAVSVLGRFDDPGIRNALRDLVERGTS